LCFNEDRHAGKDTNKDTRTRTVAFFNACVHAALMLLKQSNVAAMRYNEICPEGQREETVQE
jgi:hypothetical protein